MMRLDFAPMEGVTSAAYRRLHARIFGGADRYFIPFVSPTADHLFTPRELAELLLENNEGITAVPQILTKNAADFLWMADGLADMGYGEVNLNLGCPSPTVTAKGKGSGLLRTPDLLKALLDEIYAKCPVPVSVKTRIGYASPDEYPALLEIYNQYPIHEIILHPRSRQEMYSGTAHREAYEYFLASSKAPVCYNGDIFTAADAKAFAQSYPACPAVMLGRGAAANPALFRQIRGGITVSREEIRAFHTGLYEAYKEQCGPYNGMRRTKEAWSFLIGLFADDGRYVKALCRARGINEFEAVIADVFSNLPLKGE